jgi:hypothetical protein
MDLSEALTEPYYRFHVFRGELDTTMRVVNGSLHALREHNRAQGGVAERIPVGDEPWSAGAKWTNLPAHIANSSRFVSQMGIVQVSSAFEVFVSDVNAELARHEALNGKQSAPDEDESDGFFALCRKRDWGLAPIEDIIPLFEYFTIARNCIAHQSGRPNQQLIELHESARLADSIVSMSARLKRPIPALPKQDLCRPMQFLPRHAVLFSIVCNHLAHFANDKLVQELGVNGIVYMAAHHALLKDEPSFAVVRKNPTKTINDTLFSRYRVKGKREEAPIILKGLNRWKQCVLAHGALNSPPPERRATRKRSSRAH